MSIADIIQFILILFTILLLVKLNTDDDVRPSDRPVTREQIEDVFHEMGLEVLWMTGRVVGRLKKEYLPTDAQLQLLKPYEPTAHMLLDYLKLEVGYQPDKVLRKKK